MRYIYHTGTSLFIILIFNFLLLPHPLLFSQNCGITVDVGPDIEICSPGGFVQLNGSITGAFDDFIWESPAMLDDPRSLSPTAFINTTTTIKLFGLIETGNNLLANADFEEGNTAFMSMFTFSPGDLFPPGTYTVDVDPPAENMLFFECVDHTFGDGTGNMLMANGDTMQAALPPNYVYRVFFNNINPNTYYRIRFYATSLFDVAPSRLRVTMDETQIGNIFDLGAGPNPLSPPPPPCEWQEFDGLWFSGPNPSPSTYFSIYAEGNAAYGNDFALDDMEIREYCVEEDSLTITVTPPPQRSEFFYICEGECVDVNGTLYCSETTLSEIVTDVNGCDSIINYIVDQLEPRAEIVPVDPLSCFNNFRIFLDGSGSSNEPGTSYTWDGPNGFVFNGTRPQITEPGDYTLTVTVTQNGKSCSDTETIFVPIQDSIPNAIAGPDTSLTCLVTSVTLSGSGSDTGPFIRYEWRDENNATLGTDTSLVITEPGTYTFRVRSLQNGCIGTTEVVVDEENIPPLVDVDTGVVTCAEGGWLRFSSPEIITDVLWLDLNGDSLSTLDSIQVDSPGTYTLIARAESGCQDTFDALVLIDTVPPIFSIADDTIQCGENDIILFGPPQTRLQNPIWTGPNGFASFDRDPVATDPGTYILSMADSANGCIGLDTLELTRLTGDSIFFRVSDAIISCDPDSVQLNAPIDTALGDPQWRGPNGFSSTEVTPVVRDFGIYTLTLRSLTDGCTATDTLEVLPDTVRPVALTSDVIRDCTADSIPISVNTGPGLQASWTGPNGYTATGNSPFAADFGVYTVILRSTLNGCADTASLQMIPDTVSPSVTATSDSIDCQTPSVNLSATSNDPNATFEWRDPNNALFVGANINVSTVGIYTVTATSANGCSNSTTSEVTASDEIPDISVSGGTLTCLVDSVTISASSTTPGVTVSWTGPGGFTSTSFTNRVGLDGNYTATVRAPNGCENTAIAVVDIDTVTPQAFVADTSLTCTRTLVEPRYQVDALATELRWTGTSFSYIGTDPQITEDGMYTLRATGDNGCFTEVDFNVSIDTISPTAILAADTLTCALASLPIQATYTGQDIDILWVGPNSFNSTDSFPVVNMPGSYQVLITDGQNGCNGLAFIDVAQNIQTPDVSTLSDTISCNQLLATLSGSSQDVGVQFLWQGPNNFSNNNPVTVTAVPGDYTLIATGRNGCVDSALTTVETDTVSPTVALTADTITCDVPTVNVVATAAAAVDFVWSGPGGGFPNANSISVSEAGNYQLEVRAENGCINNATIDVAVDTVRPFVLAIGDTLSCDSTSIRLNGQASVGTQVLWEGPASFSSTLLDPRVSNPGLYTLTATAQNGCTAQAQADVPADVNLPQATVEGDTIFCDRAQAQLASQIITPGATGIWTGPGSFSSIDDTTLVSLPGEYIREVTAANGCIALFSAFILIDTISPSIAVQADTLTCLSPNTQVQASVNAQSIQNINWTGPGFNSSLLEPVLSAPGNYTVVVTDLNGCTNEANLEVSEDILVPVVSFNADTIKCNVQQVTINTSLSFGSGTYAWTGPVSFTSTLSAPQVDAPGSYILIFTNDDNGCRDTFATTVAADTVSPDVATAGGELTCDITNIQIAANSSADPRIQYQWSGPNSFQSSLATPQVSDAGVYNVIATAENGCTNTSTTTVTIDTISPSLQVNTILLDCNNLTGLLRANVAPGVDVQWFDVGNPISNTDTVRISKTGDYVAIATGPNGCETEAIALVTGDFVEPDVLANGTELSCKDSVKTITASTNTANVSFSWVGPGNYTANGASPFVNTTGQYIVTATAANGCSSTATTNVTADRLAPNAVGDVSAELDCLTDSVELDASQSDQGADISYTWFDAGNSFIGAGLRINVGELGAYVLAVRSDDNGCIGFDTVQVTEGIPAPRDLELELTNPICEGELGIIFIDSIIGGIAPYQYSLNGEPLTGNPKFDDLEAGIYTLYVQDIRGCNTTIEVEIREPENLRVLLDEEININFAETFQLKAEVNFDERRITNILWTPDTDLSCNDCLEPFVGPASLTQPYRIEITIDSNCVISDEILVRIRDERPVFFPNIFSPYKKDGYNDVFFISAPEGAIRQVNNFSIFDRWGQLLYNAQDFQPNDPAYGWDGSFKNETLNPAVFVYIAEIEFIDGKIIFYKGSITLAD